MNDKKLTESSVSYEKVISMFICLHGRRLWCAIRNAMYGSHHGVGPLKQSPTFVIFSQYSKSSKLWLPVQYDDHI